MTHACLLLSQDQTENGVVKIVRRIIEGRCVNTVSNVDKVGIYHVGADLSKTHQRSLEKGVRQ